MFCLKCGSQNNVGDVYCKVCGTPINQNNSVNNVVNNNVVNPNNMGVPTNMVTPNNMGVPNNMVTPNNMGVPNNMVTPNYNNYTNGGYVNYNQMPVTNKSNSGLIIGIVCGIVFLAIIVVTILKASSSNALAGTWDCAGSSSSNNYIVTMYLKNNGKFTWAKYGDEEKNHVKGSYTSSPIEKINAPANSQYYNLNLDGDEFISEGEIQTQKYSANYEAALITIPAEKDKLVLMNVSTYTLYYCYKR